MHCPHCQNVTISKGYDWRDIPDLAEIIGETAFVNSGVVFSGGECTEQPEALIELADTCKTTFKMNVGIHTSGIHAEVIQRLLDRALVDWIALDIKKVWSKYATDDVIRTLDLCKHARLKNPLFSFEVVITVFKENLTEITDIINQVGDVDLVLSQGMLGRVPSVSDDDLMRIADRSGKNVRIRSTKNGEYKYSSQTPANSQHKLSTDR
jgi:pyruvate-formate lyase-activating enzyme